MVCLLCLWKVQVDIYLLKIQITFCVILISLLSVHLGLPFETLETYPLLRAFSNGLLRRLQRISEIVSQRGDQKILVYRYIGQNEVVQSFFLLLSDYFFASVLKFCWIICCWLWNLELIFYYEKSAFALTHKLLFVCGPTRNMGCSI